MSRVFALLIVILSAAPAITSAQTPIEAWRLRAAADGQEDVTVDLTNGGGQIRGRLLQSAYAMLDIETPLGIERVNLAHVARVRRVRDPLIDGIFRGVTSAVLLCILTCERGPDGAARGSSVAAHVLGGGMLGATIDRAIPNGQTIYRRPIPRHFGVRRPGVTITVVF